jgi:hypothetical protein
MSDEPEVIAKLRYLHGGKVDWLTTECTTTGVTISAILAAYDGIRARLAASEHVVETALFWFDHDEHEYGYGPTERLFDAILAHRASLATPTTTKNA